ncbi:hypothetical protein LOC54_02015 [Acetobacter sp. AN02]|uniref:hypothetical protein n=1 Tax=Acetobacter sp. AN02 TaxID=2894186 RepID=UPI002434149A|nr:hypothetical protein [Acetobacter sp. AN02]MDG6093897.1 hypothetical protein [Acetobacter sp. AN02]
MADIAPEEGIGRLQDGAGWDSDHPVIAILRDIAADRPILPILVALAGGIAGLRLITRKKR